MRKLAALSTLASLGLGFAGHAAAAPGPPSGAEAYLRRLARATLDSVEAVVEPSTGLPHDRLDLSLLDVVPQLAVVRRIPYTSLGPGASLDVERCLDAACRHAGAYGLELTYGVPSATFASYNVDSPGFDVRRARFLEAWVKGAEGGEQFEIVLWSDCAGPFPGRPTSAQITAGPGWQRRRIPVGDFAAHADLSSLCRLSLGFNDAMDTGGTVYVDDIAFVTAEGRRVHVPVDEETSVTNVGLYMASEVAALQLGWRREADVRARLSRTLASLEALAKWNGFPQTHNHVVSLQPSTGDTCLSTVDLGYLAAGLVVVRQGLPDLARRASALLAAMDWAWLYDAGLGLPYGCRYPDGSTSLFHYDLYAADSRLAHLVGIGSGGMPPESWLNLDRSLEAPRCAARAGEDAHFEPGWDGGGLFMLFLPALFRDESGEDLAGAACRFTEDQACFAREIGAPAWGWSATGIPPYGAQYCGYGCVKDEMLVPHASVLGVDCVGPDTLQANLVALEGLGARPTAFAGGWGRDLGFVASVDWQTRERATFSLVLDQSMAFLALANHQTGGALRRLFSRDPLARQAAGSLAEN